MESYQNYTPHTINVHLDHGEQFEFPSQGIARVNESRTDMPSHGNIPIQKTTYGHIEGLPPSQQGVKYIVSMVVSQVNQKSLNPRDDLVSPDTGRICIRDEKGNIKAVTG